MILADKIMTLRKKSGWSQEELAEKLDVSRQSVSKWECGQSVPDLEKILKMSEIFGVSTDYLLKDEYEEMEASEKTECVENGFPTEEKRQVSMEEAKEFLEVKKWSAMRVAFATFLCIISPVCLLVLGAAQEESRISLSENAAGGIGMIVLLLIIAIAVTIFISCGNRTKPYEFLEKEPIETESGVTEMVKECQKQFRDTYNRFNMTGTILCIISAIPIFGVAFLEGNEMVEVIAVSITLLLVGIGVICFIKVGIPWSSMEKLLQEGEYTVEAKKKSKKNGTISTVYWLVVTAIYLSYSYVTNDWDASWIVWPVAGVLYAALLAVCNMVRDN